MGKYYDKLIQMNENLDKELMEKGIVNVELNTNDKLVKDDKTDIVKEDGENTIEIIANNDNTSGHWDSLSLDFTPFKASK